MKRIHTKIGDIFVVKLDEHWKKYFQYVANDTTQLNSSVIRAFKSSYPMDANPSMEDIVKDEVNFYAHTILSLGLKLGFWEKVGKSTEVGKVEVYFRDTNDCGTLPGKQVMISERWYVWKINDRNFQEVGKLTGEYRNSEIGVVINPKSIVNRMRTGKYDYFYPGYE